MTTEPFSAYFVEVMETEKDSFFANPFIRAMEAGEVYPDALLTYVQQDHRYLDRYLPLYERAYTALTKQPIGDLFGEDPEEYEAHNVLLDLAQTDDQSIQEGDYSNLPVTEAYLQHMEAAIDANPFVGLASLAACPFDYGYLAELMIQENLVTANNPFVGWVDYYRGVDWGLTKVTLDILDQEAQKVSPAIQEAARQAFLKSTKFENAFFAQAMEVVHD